jgi:hypothetical protein
MPFKSVVLLADTLVVLAGAQEQSRRQLTPRELFYSAVQEPPKAAVPAPARKSTPAKVVSVPKQSVVETTAVTPPPRRTELPDGARVVPAAAKTDSAPQGIPLGLKYTILKKNGENMVEVPADTVFRAGDRIQVSVQTNLPGYLYIVSQGSSGTWKPMFPSPEVDDGNNRVEAFRTYLLPPQSRMLFDEQTGTEKLFVVLSREPEPSLEKMIYSLQEVAPAKAPKKEEQAKAGTLLVIANPRIDDATVGILRTAYARDLVIEKVDERTPGERKETAIYVVNPTGNPDSRVVADLPLVHQ